MTVARVSLYMLVGTGVRGSDPRDIFGQQMRPIVISMIANQQDAADVVSYIGTLRAH